MANNIGLYLHIPFCRQKCAYCDFFSGKASEGDYDRYTSALKRRLADYGEAAAEKVSSVYFGGGTPSVLGADRLCDILECVKQRFALTKDAEITVELNPESGKVLDFQKLRETGFNRISVGLQSADPTELKTLGRLHTPEDASLTIRRAQAAGFDNLSLDLMLAIPHQTMESLKASVDYCASCGVKHISSYLLKIEDGTPFYSMKEQLSLPDEDEQAQLYLCAVEYLENLGYRQYEISNFAVPGYESRHNTLYWKCGEYIGLGPSAHSFYHGRRFYYPRDFRAFYEDRTADDGAGGDEDEYIMLALRLTEGLVFREFEKRFQKPLSPVTLQKIKTYARHGFMVLDEDHAAFTPKGFLVSNSVLSEIL